MRCALILTVLVIAATVASPASSEPQAATATLTLNAVIQVESRRFVACPNTGINIECTSRQGKGTMPGLGEVTVAPYSLRGLTVAPCRSQPSLSFSQR